MRIVVAHLRTEALELARHPGFLLPTLGFPALFFLLFGGGAAATHGAGAMAGYAAFAVFGVVFFQFGVGIAQERATPWQLFLRVLPAAPWQRLLARLGAAALFGTASAGIVIAVAAARGQATLTAGGWCRLAAALAAGALPFGLLGIALGYLLAPRAALPVANLLYLLLSYLGGLWTGPGGLHGVAATLSVVLPTRRWNDLVAGAAGVAPWQPAALAWLAEWGIAFAAAAIYAYRRDEARHFR